MAEESAEFKELVKFVPYVVTTNAAKRNETRVWVKTKYGYESNLGSVNIPNLQCEPCTWMVGRTTTIRMWLGARKKIKCSRVKVAKEELKEKFNRKVEHRIISQMT